MLDHLSQFQNRIALGFVLVASLVLPVDGGVLSSNDTADLSVDRTDNEDELMVAPTVLFVGLGMRVYVDNTNPETDFAEGGALLSEVGISGEPGETTPKLAADGKQYAASHLPGTTLSFDPQTGQMTGMFPSLGGGSSNSSSSNTSSSNTGTSTDNTSNSSGNTSGTGGGTGSGSSSGQGSGTSSGGTGNSSTSAGQGTSGNSSSGTGNTSTGNTGTSNTGTDSGFSSSGSGSAGSGSGQGSPEGIGTDLGTIGNGGSGSGGSGLGNSGFSDSGSGSDGISTNPGSTIGDPDLIRILPSANPTTIPDSVSSSDPIRQNPEPASIVLMGIVGAAGLFRTSLRSKKSV